MNANNVSSQVQQKIGSHSPSQKWTWSFTNVNNSDQTVYILGPQEEPPELEDVEEEGGEEEEDPVKLVIADLASQFQFINSRFAHFQLNLSKQLD